MTSAGSKLRRLRDEDSVSLKKIARRLTACFKSRAENSGLGLLMRLSTLTLTLQKRKLSKESKMLSYTTGLGFRIQQNFLIQEKFEFLIKEFPRLMSTKEA